MIGCLASFCIPICLAMHGFREENSIRFLGIVAELADQSNQLDSWPENPSFDDTSKLLVVIWDAFE
jgi:hypothetical protein